MKPVTITEASKLTGKARKTLYAHIKQGRLSCRVARDGTRLIDVAELIRVYGELKAEVTPGVTKSNAEVTPGNTPQVTPEIADLIAEKVAQAIKPLIEKIEDLTNRLEYKPDTRKEQPVPGEKQDPKPQAANSNIRSLMQKLKDKQSN